ncbi:MAG: glycosyltransferase family 2 protein [Chloroflexia bacterium]
MTEKHYPELSIVVPAYNSAPILPDLVARIAALWDQLNINPDRRELILVNDASRDNTWDVICRLAGAYDWVRGINLMRNYGQHNALLCGIRAASYDIIVTMDDDLQNPPEEVPKLLDKLAEGYDVVYGTPQKERHGLLRDLASRITKMALQSAMGAEIARNVSTYRAFRTQVRDSFASYRSPFVSIDVLLTWGTTRFAAVPVSHDVRRVGKSNYTLRKLITHALNMMTGFSVLPLQLASVVGFALTFFGILVFLYVIGRYAMEGGSVPGFPFLASIIAIFSGAQMFALGIIGEYLARMHFRSMDRPTYTVRDSMLHIPVHRVQPLTTGELDLSRQMRRITHELDQPAQTPARIQ